MRCILCLFVAILCSLVNISVAFAVITETQSMLFGSFALRNNNAAYDMVIQPNGTVVPDPEFAIISNGREAGYDVTGYPALTTLIITAVSNDLMIGGTSEPFSVLNFQHAPATVVTDAAGAASFTLGATLRTSGTTNTYIDGNYSGNATVSVNF